MFSQACKYAIRSSLFLASHASEENKMGGKEIAENLKVPFPFLAKILQKLTGNGIISSTKGRNGGFYLSEENRRVPIMDIVKCIDGSETFSSCIIGLPVCSAQNPCPLHVQAFAYREGLVYQLKHQTIGEMAKRVELEGLSL